MTREELLGRVALLAQKYEMTFEKMLKELQKRGGLDQISEDVLTAKTLEFVASHAVVATASNEAAPAALEAPAVEAPAALEAPAAEAAPAPAENAPVEETPLAASSEAVNS